MDRLGVQLYLFIEIDHSKVSMQYTLQSISDNRALTPIHVGVERLSFFSLSAPFPFFMTLSLAYASVVDAYSEIIVCGPCCISFWVAIPTHCIEVPSIVKFGLGRNLSYMCLNFLRKVIVRTPTFEWYVVGCGLKNGHKKTCV